MTVANEPRKRKHGGWFQLSIHMVAKDDCFTYELGCVISPDWLMYFWWWNHQPGNAWHIIWSWYAGWFQMMWWDRWRWHWHLGGCCMSLRESDQIPSVMWDRRKDMMDQHFTSWCTPVLSWSITPLLAMTYIYDKTCPTIFCHLLILDVSQLSHHLSHLVTPSVRAQGEHWWCHLAPVAPRGPRWSGATIYIQGGIQPNSRQISDSSILTPNKFYRQWLRVLCFLYVLWISEGRDYADGGTTHHIKHVFVFPKTSVRLGVDERLVKVSMTFFLCTIWCPPLIWLGL